MSQVRKQRLIADRFTIIKKLGEGTFGVAYIARDMKENSVVALKRARTRSTCDGLDYNTLNEMRTLSELSHPNIVKFIGVLPSKQGLFVGTEYCPYSLSALIAQEGSTNILKVSDAKCILKMLLQGMAYMHSQHFIHRDLKPDNILLTQNGIVKIIDFGLSTEYPPEFGYMISQAFTTWYRPPEVWFGSYCYGPPADVYSIGCNTTSTQGKLTWSNCLAWM